ncbi:TPA: ribonuclease E inhibitor RraB [Pseudomonas aeruginosa]|nr:ribonuclease E inhibitor RraB [Pseudomonas aeruginosa]
MEKPFSDDVSVNVLRRMKEGGFDFERIHPIDFFAIFPSEREARQAAGQFRGESLRAQVVARDDGSWNLQVSKVMYATHAAIGAFEHDLEEVVVPLGGVLDGWGVTQEVTSLRP